MNADVKKIGMIVPSSNTWAEPVSYQMLEGRDDVSIHFTRIPVTKISSEGSSNNQFSISNMVRAAELLADADVDAILWNGTAGSWLGADHDQEIVDAIQTRTGIQTSTTYLAYIDALRVLDVEQIALFTPYIDDINVKIEENLRDIGVAVENSVGLGLVVNKEFADVTADTIHTGSHRLLDERSGSTAVVYMCTNLNATPVLEDVESSYRDVLALDSIAVTLWYALKMVHAPGLSPRWGRGLA